MPFLGRVERNIPLHILAESKQNEPFLLFFIRFFTDSLFRLSRIEFPIPCKQENRLIVDDKGEVTEAPCFEYDEEAWSLRPVQLMEDRLGVKKLTLASSNSVSHNLSDMGTCFSESNTFEIRNRKWYLEKKNV